jgi:hypothetical protein
MSLLLEEYSHLYFLERLGNAYGFQFHLPPFRGRQNCFYSCQVIDDNLSHIILFSLELYYAWNIDSEILFDDGVTDVCFIELKIGER